MKQHRDHTSRSPWRIACLAALLLLFAMPATAQVIKMATLVPEGSVWDKLLKEMGAEWRESTDGQIKLRIYPGGVAGDEPDVVRKMRIGQLQAASISVAGLTEIDSDFAIFQVPMFFDSYEELAHVLNEMRPQFAAKLEAKGFVLLHWGLGGWIHFFSKQPIRGVEDLRKQKIFTWAGDETMSQLWRHHGFQAVALSATDILTGLQTGMIEALPTTPLAALSLQWFRQTPYMQNLGLAPLIGGTVMTKKTWDKLAPDVQKKLRAAAEASGRKLLQEIPDQDARAIEQMRQRGLEVVDLDDATRAEWRQAATDFASYQRQTMASTELLDAVRKARDQYRAMQPAAAPAAEAATRGRR